MIENLNQGSTYIGKKLLIHNNILSTILSVLGANKIKYISFLN